MIYIDKITRKSNLEENDSLSVYDNKWSAQQNYKAFETFFYFLKEVRPSRILDIGTSTGGFTFFLHNVCSSLNLDCKILSYDINAHPIYDEMIQNGIDVRVENVFSLDYQEVKKEVIDYINEDGITIVLCDGGSKKDEFNLLSKYLKVGDFILGHDYAFDRQFFEEKIFKKIWNWHELCESDIINCCIENNLIDYRREVFQDVVWVCKVKIDSSIEQQKSENIIHQSYSNSDVTFVTGLWDIKRGELSEGWSRNYNHYLNKFEELLKIENNLIIFGDKELEKFVFERRDIKNTQFILRDLEWIKNSTPFEGIQKIRLDENWSSQSGWLSESTQAKLEYYNPLVMSKMFLLNDARIFDKFDSKFMFWLDAGITNTIHPGYFTHDKIQNKLSSLFNKFSFICFPYKANNEIHGFSYPKINEYAQDDVKLVARGGFFGGPKQTIQDINTIYYQLLNKTISDGYMGTEESVFSIMLYKHHDIIDYIEIDDNGLISKFCEDLKNDNCVLKNISGKITPNLNKDKVALYVITFNSPNQFEVLIQSMLEYDEDFINKPQKFLLDNSTDLTTTPKYKELCEKYGFEHIKKDNLGIVGGRIFVAEHFDETGLDFYLWFEDDMAFYPKKGEFCKNGFNRYVDHLYRKILEIISKENFDFLKLNFTEFFGDNSIQWSWYNTPKEFRESHWPEKPNLPVQGLDPNAPKTLFRNIKSHEGVPYASGEIYLCNWPILLTKSGNYKCYLETKWAYPYEQTLMSYCYQETVKGNIKPGILLLTPTEHNRFEHYDGKLRKES